jgi:drug/metabolite transporter (DMT)-like permease
LLAQEPINPRILIAAMIIVGSLLLVNLAKKPTPASPATAEIT